MLYDFSVFEKEKEEWERKTGRRAEKIGSSLCKRPLYQFRIGQGRRVFAVFACFHGMEWITSAVLMDYLRESHWEETWKQANTLVAVPMVNPDGVEISLHGAAHAGRFAPLVRRISLDPIHWQANARGVDLNHNFPAGWEKLRRMEIRAGYTGPSPTRYGGEYAGSEPETEAVMQVCRQSGCERILALHSQGEEIYYDAGLGTWKPGQKERAERLACAMEQVSGYRAIPQPPGLASLGGCKDWFQLETGKPGFTVEMGKGENPLPFSQKEAIQSHMFPLLNVFLEKEPVAKKSQV